MFTSLCYCTNSERVAEAEFVRASYLIDTLFMLKIEGSNPALAIFLRINSFGIGLYNLYARFGQERINSQTYSTRFWQGALFHSLSQ